MRYGTAQANVAWLYERGVPPYVKADFTIAERYYKMAADQGDVPSTRRLGDLYFYGLVGSAPDMRRAFEAYRSYGDDAESLHSLAHMYEHGYGTEKNVTLARATYERALALSAAAQRNTSMQSLPSKEGALASDLALLSLNLKESLSSAASVFRGLFSGSSPPPPPPAPPSEEL